MTDVQCAYEAHRGGSDWRRTDSPLVVCGICHPTPKRLVENPETHELVLVDAFPVLRRGEEGFENG